MKSYELSRMQLLKATMEIGRPVGMCLASHCKPVAIERNNVTK